MLLQAPQPIFQAFEHIWLPWSTMALCSAHLVNSEMYLNGCIGLCMNHRQLALKASQIHIKGWQQMKLQVSISPQDLKLLPFLARQHEVRDVQCIIAFIWVNGHYPIAS